MRDRYDELTVREKVTTGNYTGYAFSGTKGHDILVTDSLANRFRDALTDKIGIFNTMNKMENLKVDPGALRTESYE
jgi:hypothetical protein